MNHESEVVLDSSALMAVINSETGANMVTEMLTRSAMSAVNLSEVIARLADRDIDENSINSLMREFPFRVFPLDEAQAFQAGILRASTRDLGLSLGDRCCLSLARSLGIAVLTADRAWTRLSIGVEIQLIR